MEKLISFLEKSAELYRLVFKYLESRGVDTSELEQRFYKLTDDVILQILNKCIAKTFPLAEYGFFNASSLISALKETVANDFKNLDELVIEQCFKHIKGLGSWYLYGRAMVFEYDKLGEFIRKYGKYVRVDSIVIPDWVTIKIASVEILARYYLNRERPTEIEKLWTWDALHLHVIPFGKSLVIDYPNPPYPLADLKIFKKGTIWIVFRSEMLVDQFNRYLVSHL